MYCKMAKHIHTKYIKVLGWNTKMIAIPNNPKINKLETRKSDVFFYINHGYPFCQEKTYYD